MSKPVFDLIIGCNSMEKLGIVLDFKAKSITLQVIVGVSVRIPHREFKAQLSKNTELWVLIHEYFVREVGEAST